MITFLAWTVYGVVPGEIVLNYQIDSLRDGNGRIVLITYVESRFDHNRYLFLTWKKSGPKQIIESRIIKCLNGAMWLIHSTFLKWWATSASASDRSNCTPSHVYKHYQKGWLQKLVNVSFKQRSLLKTPFHRNLNVQIFACQTHSN